MVYSDRSGLELSDAIMRIQNFHFSRIYDEKLLKITEIATLRKSS